MLVTGGRVWYDLELNTWGESRAPQRSNVEESHSGTASHPHAYRKLSCNSVDFHTFFFTWLIIYKHLINTLHMNEIGDKQLFWTSLFWSQVIFKRCMASFLPQSLWKLILKKVFLFVTYYNQRKPSIVLGHCYFFRTLNLCKMHQYLW